MSSTSPLSPAFLLELSYNRATETLMVPNQSALIKEPPKKSTDTFDGSCDGGIRVTPIRGALTSFVHSPIPLPIVEDAYSPVGSTQFHEQKTLPRDPFFDIPV
jgi:hypothetical protein